MTAEQELARRALPVLKNPDDVKLQGDLFRWLKDSGVRAEEALLPMLFHGLAMVHERLAALEARSAKALPSCSWKGVFVAGQVYRPGDLVTRSGGLWLCTAQTTSAPSGDPATWKLIVKEGQAR